jgi:pimeloyl-ACP methyl ester carboxylesterase
MKTLLAALAAAILPLALAAPVPTAASEAIPADPAVNEYDHIRTTLYGDSGPVAVLIPGMSTPGAVWDDTVEALSGEMRLLVLEVRGMEGARAPANERPGMLAGIVADLSTDLAARALPPARIVGHSFGGLVAMQFGLDHPDQAESLLVIDALPFFGTVFGAEQTVESIEPQAAGMRSMLLAQAETMRAAGARGTENPAGGAGMSIVPANQLKIANWSLKAEPTVVAQAIYEDMQADLRQEIARLERPLTVVYAAEESAEFAHERYRTDYSAYPAARFVPAARSGHFIMLDRPDLVRDEVARGLVR